MLSLYSAAEEITESGSFEWDLITDETRFSLGMYRVLGLPQDSKPNLHQITSLVHSDDVEEFEKLIAGIREMEPQSNPVVEFRIIRGDGLFRYIWMRFSPVFNKHNQTVRLLGAVQDITERKRRETLTEVIYNISQAASQVTSFHSFYQIIQKEINKLLDANNMFVAFYDEKQDQLDLQFVTGESHSIRFVPAEGTISKLVIQENCSLLLDNATLLDFDARGKIKRIGRSSKTWLGVPLRKDSEPFGVLVVQNYERTDAFDAEDQALLEFISIQLVSAIRSMQDSEQIQVLNNSIRQSPVSVVITNKEGNIEYVNPKFEQVTGFSFEEVIGENPRILNGGKNPPDLYEQMWLTILKGEEWRGEFQNRRKDGSFYWELASISPVKNKDGEISHFVAVKEDITERKKLESELILAKDKAEESDKLKSAFLANMSHEIRTPMNGILGFSELLRETDLSEQDLNRYIEIINTNGRQLLGIIDDIITVSNLEVKQLKLNLRQFDLVTFLENLYMTIEMERRMIDKNHIELSFPKFEDRVFFIEMDEGKLLQVLVNLLKNALKFTDQGTVSLEVAEKEKNILIFIVRDTGIGIPADMHEIIFDRFRQVDDSNTRSFGGTGLGLAISKGLVELLGGRIWVDSNPGKGSQFGFTLPFKKLDYEID